MANIFKNLQVKFVGCMDWIKFRDFFVLKLQECSSEKDLNLLIQTFLASMFRNVKEINQTRKKLNLKLLSDIEKRKINKFVKEEKKKE